MAVTVAGFHHTRALLHRVRDFPLYLCPLRSLSCSSIFWVIIFVSCQQKTLNTTLYTQTVAESRWHWFQAELQLMCQCDWAVEERNLFFKNNPRNEITSSGTASDSSADKRTFLMTAQRTGRAHLCGSGLHRSQLPPTSLRVLWAHFSPTEDRKGLKQTSFLNDSGKHFFADIVYSPEFCLWEEKKKR